MDNQNTSVTTGEVRISYEHIMKPYAMRPDAEAKYSATLLIPKTDVTTKAAIDAAIRAATDIGVNAKWNGQRPVQVPQPVWDGDGLRQNGARFGPECAGHWVVTASSKQKQDVVDIDGNIILDASEVYSGMYARAYITFFAYNNAGKRGIGCGLGPVQKLRDGEPLDGRVSAQDVFGGRNAISTPAPYNAPAQASYAAPAQASYAAPATRINPITGQPVRAS